MSTRRHRIAAIALALVVSFAATACGTNFSAQTNQQYQAGVGANIRTGDVQVFNALFVDNGDGTATFSGAVLAAEDDESLTEVSTKGGKAAFAGPVDVAKGELVTLGAEGELIVTLGDTPVGGHVEVTLTSKTGSSVTADAPVVDRTSTYESVAKKSTGTDTTEDASDTDEDTEVAEVTATN